jgi:nucleoside-diphosphate-sugar epimerase
MKVLIGHTGLVGSTLTDKIKFDFLFNTKNIETFNNYNFDGYDLYLSCLPATKWMVNKNITSDLNNMISIIDIISKFNYNKIYLISTIDVYCDSPLGSDENYNPNFSDLNYGSNRLLFEKLIKNYLTYEKIYTFRLPAVFNKKIKKNVIYDLINNNNVDQINVNSKYQWYNLDYLDEDINFLISTFPNETIFNLFTEPIDTKEIVDLFENHKDKVVYNKNSVVYDFKTKHFVSGYLKNKTEIFDEIKKFVNESSRK